MNNNLVEFYTSVKTAGFSKDYLGKVSLLDFSYLNEEFYLDSEDLLYVKDFTLPGIVVEETSVKIHDYIVKSTANTLYNKNNIDITFYTDQFYYIRDLFEKIIYAQKNNSTTVDKNTQYSNLILTILNENLDPIYDFDILGAKVLGISPVTYNLAGNGNIQELKLTFAYAGYNIYPSNYLNGEIYEYGTNRETNTLDFAAARGPGGTASTNSGSQGALGSLIAGLNTIARTAQAVGGTASAIRGAGRAIRGR